MSRGLPTRNSSERERCTHRRFLHSAFRDTRHVTLALSPSHPKGNGFYDSDPHADDLLGHNNGSPSGLINLQISRRNEGRRSAIPRPRRMAASTRTTVDSGQAPQAHAVCQRAGDSVHGNPGGYRRDIDLSGHSCFCTSYAVVIGGSAACGSLTKTVASREKNQQFIQFG